MLLPGFWAASLASAPLRAFRSFVGATQGLRFPSSVLLVPALLLLAAEDLLRLFAQLLIGGAVSSGSAAASFFTREAARPASVRASMAQDARPTAPPSSALV
jgi:hypothetical protein